MTSLYSRVAPRFPRPGWDAGIPASQAPDLMTRCCRHSSPSPGAASVGPRGSAFRSCSCWVLPHELHVPLQSCSRSAWGQTVMQRSLCFFSSNGPTQLHWGCL